MTVKQFFKSVTFKCIIVLSAILVICGAFLTVAFGFLEVTDGERLGRAVEKIYGKTVDIYGYDNDNLAIVSTSDRQPVNILKKDEKVTIGQADISQAYLIAYEDGGELVLEYLVQSKGKGGYSGGSVTLWVALATNMNGATVELNEDGKIEKINGLNQISIAGINNVIVSENSGQSFIGNITNAFLGKFSDGFSSFDSVADVNFNISDGYVVSGTSRSSNAICNGVNGAVEFVDVNVLGHSRTSNGGESNE